MHCHVTRSLIFLIVMSAYFPLAAQPQKAPQRVAACSLLPKAEV